MTAFSQVGTESSEKTKCFPIPIVKKITQDLLRGDSAIFELKLTNQLLDSTEKKVVIKDNIISSYVLKEKNYIKIIDLEREKYNTLEDFNKTLQTELKKQKLKSKLTSISSVSLAGILVFFLFIK